MRPTGPIWSKDITTNWGIITHLAEINTRGGDIYGVLIAVELGVRDRPIAS